jgi:hypothetical protein
LKPPVPSKHLNSVSVKPAEAQSAFRTGGRVEWSLPASFTRREKATVDAQVDACDVARERASKERDRIGQFSQLACPAKWDLREQGQHAFLNLVPRRISRRNPAIRRYISEGIF